MASSIAAAMQQAKVPAAPTPPPLTVAEELPRAGRFDGLAGEDLENVMTAFGQSVRMRREALGIDQGEFAAVLGMTQSNVSYYERGSAKGLTLNRAIQIAKILGMNLNALLAECECKEETTRLKKIVDDRAAHIDAEIKEAETRLAELRQLKATAARIVNGSKF